MAYQLRRSVMGLTAVGLAMLSCSSSSATGSPGAGSGNSAVCLPGHEVACGCADGRESARSCKADGSGYLACICGTGGAAGEAGAASSAGAAEDAAGASAQ